MTLKKNDRFKFHFVDSVKLVYKVISILAFVLTSTLGSIYIYFVAHDFSDIFAWVIYSVSHVINFYYGYKLALINGENRYDITGKIVVINRSVFLVISTALMIQGLELMALSIGACFGALISRIYLNLKYDQLFQFRKFKSNPKFQKLIIIRLLYFSKKMSYSQVSAFIMQKSGTLYIAFYLGLQSAAVWGFINTAIYAIFGFSSMYSRLNLTKLSEYAIKSNKSQYMQTVITSFKASSLIYIACVVFSYFLIPHLLSATGKESMLFDYNLFISFSIIVLLELIHSTSATFITIFNKIPFVKASIITALIVVILSPYTLNNFGLYGYVFLIGLVNLAYNNWRWPLYLRKEINSIV